VNLIDRYGKGALGMAAFQLVLLLISLGYGLASPSLGAKVILPGLVMTTTFGVAIWLTLHTGWDWSYQPGDTDFSWRVHAWIWDPGLIVGISLWLSSLHRGLFETAKAAMQRFASDDVLERAIFAEEIQAWDADTWGAVLLQGPAVVTVFVVPCLLLGMLWFFLPR
jgi:hypothetical protein